MKKTFQFVLSVLATLSFIVGIIVHPAHSSEDKINVAALLDLTGSYSQFGVEARQAMELGLEETKNVEVHFFDTKGELKTANHALDEVIKKGDYHVVVTLASWVTNGLAARIKSAGMLQMAIGSAAFDYADQKNCVRFTGDVDSEIVYLVDHLKEFNKVAVMYLNNDYGIKWNNALKSALGSRLVKSISYADGDKNFTVNLQAIKTGQPDALAMIGTKETVQIVQQASRLGIKSAMFGARPTLTNQLLAEPEAKGLMFSYPQLQENLPVFFSFKNKYGYRMSAFGAEGYDLVKSLDGFYAPGKTGKNIFMNYQNSRYDGALGLIQFDGNAQAEYSYTICIIKNGTWERLKMTTP